MKNIILTTVLLAAIFIIAAPCSVSAQDSLNGKLTLRTNTINPDEGDSFQASSILLAFTPDKVTFGLDIDQGPSFLRFDPYIKKALDENWAIKGGITTDNKDKDYLYGTVSYGTNFGKLSTFIDVENNFPVSSGAKDKGFTDIFWGASYPINKKISIGPNGYWDRWWENKDEAAMIGLKTSYSLDEKTTLGIRVARSWFLPEGEESLPSVDTRVELSTKF